MNKYKYYIENFEILSLYWYHFMILVEKFIFVVFDNVKLAYVFLTSLTKRCSQSWAFIASRYCTIMRRFFML